MKRKSPGFLDLLETFLNDYMINSEGLSVNTIKSYKSSFRLLLEYMYAEKSICPDAVTFKTLGFDTVNGFLNWLEQEGEGLLHRDTQPAACRAFIFRQIRAEPQQC